MSNPYFRPGSSPVSRAVSERVRGRRLLNKITAGVSVASVAAAGAVTLMLPGVTQAATSTKPATSDTKTATRAPSQGTSHRKPAGGSGSSTGSSSGSGTSSGSSGGPGTSSGSSGSSGSPQPPSSPPTQSGGAPVSTSGGS